MGARESVMAALRRALYVSPLVLTVNENVASMCGVEGRSMQPTFNPEGQLLSDRVILDKLCARYCTFQRGDVIVLRSPTEPHAHLIKRLLAMPGDWVAVPAHQAAPQAAVGVPMQFSEAAQLDPHPKHSSGGELEEFQGGFRKGFPGRPQEDSGWGSTPFSGLQSEYKMVPKGHCWVEGDNGDLSYDSKNFGPVPLALIEGRVSYIVWPPHRMSKVARSVSSSRVFRRRSHVSLED